MTNYKNTRGILKPCLDPTATAGMPTDDEMARALIWFDLLLLSIPSMASKSFEAIIIRAALTPCPAVDIEEIKRKENPGSYDDSYAHGWNDCIDYLQSKRHLK